MVHYNEDDICGKCNKQLETEVVKYNDYHDGGCYEESYIRVKRDSAKQVGLRFYCNDCYNKIGNSKTNEIINDANKFINIDINSAVIEVQQQYDMKMNQLKELRQYIENGILFLKDYNTISELSEEELRYITKHHYLYKPNYQAIKIGFCTFDSYSEVMELINIKTNSK